MAPLGLKVGFGAFKGFGLRVTYTILGLRV